MASSINQVAPLARVGRAATSSAVLSRSFKRRRSSTQRAVADNPGARQRADHHPAKHAQGWNGRGRVKGPFRQRKKFEQTNQHQRQHRAGKQPCHKPAQTLATRQRPPALFSADLDFVKFVHGLGSTCNKPGNIGQREIIRRSGGENRAKKMGGLPPEGRLNSELIYPNGGLFHQKRDR